MPCDGGCRFCGKGLPAEGSWGSGFCDAECCFRFFTFQRPKTETEVMERNEAMEEIIRLYRSMEKNLKDGTIDLGELLQKGSEPSKTRIVLEVIGGFIQYAYCDGGPLEILVANHDTEEEKTFHLPRGTPGPLVSASIWTSLEIKFNPKFVEETFKRAKE